MTGSLKCYLWPLLLQLLFSCDSFEPDKTPTEVEGSVTPAASMNTARSGQTATVLPSGQVLIAGGMNGNGNYFDTTEIYDPSSNRFVEGSKMSERRIGHTATRLPSGKVLIAGGFNGDYLQSAEVYDPSTGRFSPTGRLTVPRSEHLAVLLNDGRVLLVGGVGGGYSFLASCEVFDPATGRFSPTGSMTMPREGHTATLLKNGKVLITGGHQGRREAMTVYSSAELYDPSIGRFTTGGEMTVVRHKHAAALLPDGNVLIVGGSDNRDFQGQYASAEIYDADKSTFKAIANMTSARYKLTGAVAVLKDGRVLIGGGASRVEIYDPAKNSFTAISGELDAARFFSSATLLADGRVLIAGGYDNHGASSVKAWLCDSRKS
ncbi:MAG TPA: kelch repeat-containing protein [Blastocatellia bacterium]|nr:kelch repeat-containing protein [Blastocatellia bacterium]